MKTSYKELSDLFRLKNDRQIKANLSNKLTVIDDNNIKISDSELKLLLKKFRSPGQEVLEIQDVCEQYDVTREQLLILIKEERVSHFKLLNENGSKILFFKSELDEEKEYLLVHYRRKDRFKHIAFFNVLLKYLLKNAKIDKRDRDVFIMFFTKEFQIEDIAKNFDLTPTRVLQIINDVYPKMLDAMQEFINHIQKEKEIKNTKIPDILLTKIDDLDLSIRIKNAIKNSIFPDLKNLKEFLNVSKTKKDWVKLRNFGKNSADELEEFILKHGVELED